MLNEENIHMFFLRGGIPLSGTIIYMTFFFILRRLGIILFAVNQTHGYSLLCP